MRTMRSVIADNFKDAYNRLGLELITRVNFDSYYVARDDSPILELKNRISMDIRPSKYLFTGLRASGKTTELRRLKFMLEHEYFVVYFSVLDVLDLTDIEYVDLLLCMGLKTLEAIKDQSIDIDKDIIEDLHSLFKEISGEHIVSHVAEKKKEVSVGGRFFALIVEILGRYKSETVTRIEIREKIEKLIQDFLERFNLLIVELQKKAGKPLLLILDDLEKVDLKRAEEIYHRHSSTLTRPICKAVFTIPLSLIYAPCWKQIEISFNMPPHFLPLKAVKTKNGEVDERGEKFLKEIVLKRVSPELFEKGVLEKTAGWSGGVVVDFLRMVRGCCVKAQGTGLKKISVDLAVETFSSLVDSYWRPLEEKYYPKLVELHKKKVAKNDEELRFLLYLCVVLEYDTKRWYDLHPAVERILYEIGLIKD